MKKLAMTAVLALSLGSGGCAMLMPSPPPPPSSGEPASDLRTMIMPTGTSYDESLAFQVNRAAYAAVFRIAPGQGAMMIYPRPGFGARDGFLFSGFHRVVTGGAGSSFVSTLDGGVLPAWRRGAAGSDYGPEYYFVVVSDRPLRLDGRMYGLDSWLRSANGGPAMMNWIVSQVVPDPGAGDWTTDYYVHWPETISTVPTSGLIPLTCGGKRVWANPDQYDRAVSVLCTEQRPEDIGRPRPDPGQPPTADEDELVEPRRRDPVPAETAPTERIVSRQLQEPEAWEQARSTLAERRRPAVPADLLPGADLSPPAARGEIERMFREAERIDAMRDVVDPALDIPGPRLRSITDPLDGDFTRPGFDRPRLRPTFEVPEPSPPPSFEAPPAVETPPPPPPAPPAERAPSDANPGEGVTRRRPTVE